MAITVYWANIEREWLLAKEPELVSRTFYDHHKNMNYSNSNLAINKCPAFNDHLNNLYAVRSIYDYSFTITPDGNVVSQVGDQRFFNEHVIVRSVNDRMFSFLQRNVFFTDEDSLDMTLYEFPVYEDNNITKRCQPVTGMFDIGKWFRNSEFAFFLKKEYDTFVIEKDEIYMYLRFHTKQKIRFKQFRMSRLLVDYLQDGLALNNFHTNIYLGKLENYYKHLKHKKLILKEIKNNLL